MTRLNVDALEKALSQLELGLHESASAKSELMRDGVIQRFDYTMDLCWKLLQRYLREIAEVEESALRSKKDLFREGARLGLLWDAESWIGLYEARNQTSHTYDGSTAQAVFDRARPFAADARAFLEALRHAA